VNPPGPKKAFQLRAVEKWLDLHKTNVGFVDMFDRNLAPDSGAAGLQWSKSNPIDAQLLPLLNQYCFRCHSSLRYHVFDKDGVVARKQTMVNRLNLAADNKFAMPQDRDLKALNPHDHSCLLQLLPHVGENAQIICPPQ